MCDQPGQFHYNSSVENLLLQQEQQIDYNGGQPAAAEKAAAEKEAAEKEAAEKAVAAEEAAVAAEEAAAAASFPYENIMETFKK